MPRSIRPLMLCLVCFASIAQAAPSIVGSWVAAPKNDIRIGDVKGFRFTFAKGGAFTFTGFHTVGKGTYKLTGTKIKIVLSERNGVKPNNPQKREAEGSLVEGGKAILMSTGMTENGKPVMLRLVRKS